MTTGALPAPPTIFRIRSSTSQSNPLSAGRLRVRVPSDPPFSRSVAQYSERPAWDREVAGGTPAAPTVSKCCRGRNRRGVRLLNEPMQVQLPSSPPFYRSVAQSLERAAWDREVAGGNPAVPTISKSTRMQSDCWQRSRMIEVMAGSPSCAPGEILLA